MKFILFLGIAFLTANLALAESETHEGEEHGVELHSLERDESEVMEFLNASRKAERIQRNSGRVCRVVCFPGGTYAPPGCITICETNPQ